MDATTMLPQKREVDEIIVDQRPAKFQKLHHPQPAVDPLDTTVPMQLESRSSKQVKSKTSGFMYTPGDRFCYICEGRTDHPPSKCPNESKLWGMACKICVYACDNNEKGHEKVYTVKGCVECGCMKHWTNECTWFRNGDRDGRRDVDYDSSEYFEDSEDCDNYGF